ncbi:hypothetical protein DFH09DRAFT_1375839, partial [Mycena vulgaris]
DINGDRHPKDGCRTHERHNGYLGRRLHRNEESRRHRDDGDTQIRAFNRTHDQRTPRQDALDRKSVEIGQDIPAAWYTFNSKSGEPTRTKLGWDGSEVTWRTSDCT